MINLVGRKIGHLIVDSVTQTDGETEDPVVYSCTCAKCGKHGLPVLHSDLVRNCVLNCGCSDPTDLTGMEFSNLVVIERSPIKGFRGQEQWKCKCKLCGKEVLVTYRDLVTGHRKSCGCLKTHEVPIGYRVHYLEVISPPMYDTYGGKKCRLYKCFCHKCAKRTIMLPASAILRGTVKTCGCARGLFNTAIERKLIRKYDSMMHRCYSPKASHYDDYGGRGISVCDEWRNSQRSFIDWSIENGYEPGLSLERVDVNGPYSPSNCKWIDLSLQARNRRTSHFVEVNGERKTIAEWAEILGMKYITLYNYLWRHSEDTLKSVISSRLSSVRDSGL